MTYELPGAWNPTIPDDVALEVGRFLAATSLMDHALERLIWHLLGSKNYADLKPLTWNLSSGVRRDIITDLLSRRDVEPEELVAWNEAKPLLKEVSENRNWVAHGFWWEVPPGYVRMSKGKMGAFKPVNAKDVEMWTATAREAIARLVVLLPYS